MGASSIFMRFLRAILLNETVFNSDNLILRVLKEALPKSLHGSACKENHFNSLPFGQAEASSY